MEQPTRRRLARGHDRIIAGVASGLAEYLDLDPTVVRALWVVVTIFGLPLSLVAYFVLAIIMPTPEAGMVAPEPTGPAPVSRDQGVLLLGAVLVVVGLLLALRDLSWMHWIGLGMPHVVVPILLIVAGAFLLIRRMREG